MMLFKQQREKERGQAVLELALVLPLLVLIMAAICDLGRAMTCYSAHVGIVRDAANLGSRIIDLSASSVVTSGATIQQLGPGAAGHLLMHYRARQLLLLRDRSVDFSKVSLTSRYDSNKQLVTFSMTLTFPTIFGSFFGAIPITTSMKFPYSMASGQQGGVSPPSDGCSNTLQDSWSTGPGSGGDTSASEGSGSGGSGGVSLPPDTLFMRGNPSSSMKTLVGGGGGLGGGAGGGGGSEEVGLPAGNPIDLTTANPGLTSCLQL